MNEDPEYKSIEQLAASVKANVDELAHGTLSLNEIDQVVTEMRDLYERLVVIRHGVFQTESVPETPELLEKNDPSAEDQKMAEGSTLFKLDTEQPIEEKNTPENQVSLIDVIEEIGGESLNEKMADTSEGSLAEKLEAGAIPNIKSAIGLNQKFWFIKELFNEDKEAFENALNELEQAGDHGTAQKWFDAEVRIHLKDDHDQTALRKFLELVERRYTADA